MFPSLFTANSTSVTGTPSSVRFRFSAIQKPENHVKALDDAVFLHRSRPLRSGEETPDFAHQEGVESLIFKHGGKESEAIAGLFHDGIEKDGTHWVVPTKRKCLLL